MNVFLAITVCAAAVGAANVQLDLFRNTYLFADVCSVGWRATPESLTKV